LQKNRSPSRNWSNNIVFKIPVIRARPDVYSTIVAVIQDEMKAEKNPDESGKHPEESGKNPDESGKNPEESGNESGKNPDESGKLDDDPDEDPEEEEDCLRIIEETAVDLKSLPGRMV
jgi:hypothetical protein